MYTTRSLGIGRVRIYVEHEIDDDPDLSYLGKPVDFGWPLAGEWLYDTLEDEILGSDWYWRRPDGRFTSDDIKGTARRDNTVRHHRFILLEKMPSMSDAITLGRRSHAILRGDIAIEVITAHILIDGEEVAYDCLGGVEAGDRSYVESEERTVVLGAIAQARKHLNERIEE
jgi:hypothetical protein